jgi:hypothetical protein
MNLSVSVLMMVAVVMISIARDVMRRFVVNVVMYATNAFLRSAKDVQV